MGFLTDPNGFFMELLRKISDIVFCNVLFCVLSLPVITAGAAMTGLSAAMQLIAEDKEDEGKSALRVFWQNFKDHFLRATLLWLSGLLGIAFLLLYYHTVNSLEGGTQHLYRITFYALVLVFFAGYQYVFPMLARFGQLGLMIPAAAVVLTFFLRPERFGGAVFFWAVIGFGLTAYLTNLAYLRAFRKIEENMQ